jgi:hypothetical protein
MEQLVVGGGNAPFIIWRKRVWKSKNLDKLDIILKNSIRTCLVQKKEEGSIRETISGEGVDSILS